MQVCFASPGWWGGGWLPYCSPLELPTCGKHGRELLQQPSFSWPFFQFSQSSFPLSLLFLFLTSLNLPVASMRTAWFCSAAVCWTSAMWWGTAAGIVGVRCGWCPSAQGALSSHWSRTRAIETPIYKLLQILSQV